MRADQLIVQRGLAPTRAAAQRLIGRGAVRWRATGGWRVPRKSGEDLPDDCELDITDDAELRFVSRGGLKLVAALERTGVDPAGAICLDLGQSTGGFTDALLQRGAARVVGIDVGHGQLHPRLAVDPRVLAFERLHVRDLVSIDATSPDASRDLLGAERCSPTSASASVSPSPAAAASAAAAAFTLAPATTADPGFARAAPPGGFDIVVADLSFISLTHALPAVARWLHPAGHALLLTKPQFELQPGDIGKGGLVKDPAAHARVQARIREACAAAGLLVRDYFESAVEGGDGNREFFTWASRRTDSVAARPF